MSTLPFLSDALRAGSQILVYARLALAAHDHWLGWGAYNVAVCTRHGLTTDGLTRLIMNTPMRAGQWGALSDARAHRLLGPRARSYVHDVHLFEGVLLTLFLLLRWRARHRRRAARRAAGQPAPVPAGPMGYPMPYPYPQPAYQGSGATPRPPSEGSAGRLAGAAGSVALSTLLALPRGAVGLAGLASALRDVKQPSAPAPTRTAKGAMSLQEMKEGGWLTSNGWPVGTVKIGRREHLVTINHETQCAHVMVSGSPGSGKSKTQLVPWTFSEIKLPKRLRASMVLMDPKPDAELTNTTIGVMERAGWRVWVYDPFSVGSMRLNVLGLCADAEEVEALIDAWVIGVIGVDHPTIGQPTKRVLTAVATHLRAEAGDDGARVSLADVARFVKDDEDGDACLDVAGIKEKAKGITAMDGARDATRVLLNPNVAASMDGNDWDTDAFLAVPTIVYVPIAMGKRKASRPFFTTIFPMMFNEFTRASNGLPLKRRVRILADEFANMSPVKAFDDFISAVRYLDVGTAVASQGVSDIKVMYAGDWPRIEASLTTRLHLPRKGTAIISQEAAAPIIVTTRFWQRDPLMKLRVRLGKRRLTKVLALARQLRQQQHLPATTVAAAGDAIDTAELEPGEINVQAVELEPIEVPEPATAAKGQPAPRAVPEEPEEPEGAHDTAPLIETVEAAPNDPVAPVSLNEWRATKAARESIATAESATPTGIDQADAIGDYSARNEGDTADTDAGVAATGTEGGGALDEAIRALRVTGLTHRQIAGHLGQSPSKVYRRMKELGL